jgi:hypothetical protein
MKACVRKRQRLLCNRGHDLWMSVTRVEDGNAGREVDETPSIHIPDLGIFCLDCIDALGPNAVCNRRRFPS